MTECPRKPEHYLHRLFEIGLLLKALFAGSEILAAIGAYLVPLPFLARLVAVVTRSELAEDPHDIIANYLVQWAANVSLGTKRFLTLYLLSHGAIKLWLITGLLRRRLWYYPTALIVFALFVIYQLYRYTFAHSGWLLVITAVDTVVIGLTWHEYGYLRRFQADRP